MSCTRLFGARNKMSALETDPTCVENSAARPNGLTERIRDRLTSRKNLHRVAKERRTFFLHEQSQGDRRALLNQFRSVVCGLGENTETPGERTKQLQHHPVERASSESSQVLDTENTTAEDNVTLTCSRDSNRARRIGTAGKSPGWKDSAAFYSKQLITYDWMIWETLPVDMSTNWLVILRPEGTRCLVIIKQGVATVRDKWGRLIGQFRVCDRANTVSFVRGGLTVLDCVLGSSPTPIKQEICEIETPMELSDRSGTPTAQVISRKPAKSRIDTGLLWICDALWWNDVTLCDSGAECRYFFLKSRYDECFDESQLSSDKERFIFRLAEVRECTTAHVEDLYTSSTAYLKDSFVFVHKDAHYIPGFNPLWICWRDAHLSRYYIDRPSKVEASTCGSSSTLQYAMNEDEKSSHLSRTDLLGFRSETMQSVLATRHQELTKQVVCLEFCSDGFLKTLDDVILARLSDISEGPSVVKPGQLVK
eukprot:GHVQ01009279.1.p1 GENE.GHVQ01009279.1~~GHVQ01009279.1.p1  ORF type:complete len:480 (-),score=31.72 GHVQ01009279.1:6823-8262(-)